jgi:hypothetical protein
MLVAASSLQGYIYFVGTYLENPASQLSSGTWKSWSTAYLDVYLPVFCSGTSNVQILLPALTMSVIFQVAMKQQKWI